MATAIPVMENGKRKTVPGYRIVRVFNHTEEFSNLYEQHSEYLIGDWKAEDRAEREWLWRREQQLLHKMPDERGWGSSIDPVPKTNS